MNKINISAKLYIGFFVVIAIMAALTVVSIRQVSGINDQLVTVNEINSVKQRYAINFRGSVHDRAIAIRDVVILESELDRSEALKTIDALAQTYAENEILLNAMLAPDQAPAKDELDIAADIAAIQARTNPLVDQVIALQAAGDTAGARALLNDEVSPLFSDWLAAINRFIDFQEARNKSLGEQVSRSAGGFVWVALSALLIGVVMAAAVAFLVGRSISRPVNSLSAVMRRLAAGEYEVEVKEAARLDEIGAMAKTVEVFRQNGLKVAQLTAAEAAAAAAAEAERQRGEAAREQAAQAQARVVSALDSSLERLALGRLDVEIETAFPESYESIRRNFNAAIAQLRQTISSVQESTTALRGGASEVAASADELSRRTEQQAASLEESAAALDEITATVAKTAQGSQKAQAAVDGARKGAEASAVVVNEAVAAMGQIEESAKQISQIIGVIDEIAFQTNLLALNAGVEAARAGEAGRGFAVVASEVRALAQRSADAAKEIKSLITTSTEQVGVGVVLVNKAGEALSRISTDVSDINRLIGEIAAGAQEQAIGLEQVNRAINEMDQMTQRNAAMVEESTEASRQLTEQTDALAAQVAQFRLSADATVRTLTPAPGRAAPRAPAARQVNAYRSQGAAAVKVASLPETQAEAEGWEEF